MARLPQLPMELVSNILMLRESPKHAEIINTCETKSVKLWENGKTKYTIFFNDANETHKIGAPALVCWDEEGNKVFEEWVKLGVIHRSGSNPARTYWDSNGKISHEILFNRGQLIEMKKYDHGSAKVWSSTYELWVDGIVGMDVHGPKYILENDAGESYEYPESMLEFA
uniref:Uncharacterized protein n=1 Tax=viral metagenome TaxID=1070528 RepID=A0A6C0KEJ7_9ZZZZ